jgi:hypothetical protein
VAWVSMLKRALVTRFWVSLRRCPPDPVDFLFVNLKIVGTRVLVAVIYCPQRIDGYPYYGLFLEQLADSYPRYIIMGDINVDLLRDSVASRSLVESLSLSVINRGRRFFYADPYTGCE